MLPPILPLADTIPVTFCSTLPHGPGVGSDAHSVRAALSSQAVFSRVKHRLSIKRPGVDEH
jgi:hypothetical protein